jgi:hypothetical protein
VGKEMVKNNVFFFKANKELNIINAINHDKHEKFVCYGTGNRAFKKAMDEVNPEETVYQIKMEVNKVEVLYRY